MITHPEKPARGSNPSAALRYALIPVHGYGIAVATVARMLDDGADGGRARVLSPAEAVPYGAQPVLLAETTVYGARQVEEVLRRWGPLPRPWLVWVSDAPARPVPDARYLVRALEGRLAGVARVAYLPVLRGVKDADEAMEHKTVQTAAQKLRRALEGTR
ncbi:hypothetical protein GCM10010363_60420 [Streptomyces omiyaensis]|uniref:hypothetical protein n=1 Tax=Streptomyces omiyaensis TaxID=68247 RepID=UPI00167AB23E|nr:hypothetical protein [Streptomyces omiyaensis]GGY71170.1 hypothetical protein GCM10010363_60420 [Streptomyces omiyaensis]